MKKNLTCLTIILHFALLGLSQYSHPAFSNIIDKLTLFSSTNIIEKTYLQFDKPYYAAGDTLYFKAYITEGEQHRLSTLSGILHVDLINPEYRLAQSIELRIDSGICWGDFALPDSLLPGQYRVRAYTQWMRNSDETSFFNKIIPIGSLQNNSPDSLAKQIPQATVGSKQKGDTTKDEFQFFPEGGNWVTSLRTKMGFKAMGANGLATNVKGVILDKENKTVDSFASTHLGMGYFVFAPLEGNRYKAKLTFADGTKRIMDLPTPDSAGISLTVNNLPAKLAIRIAVNKPYYLANQNKDFFLVIYSGGKAITAPFTLDTYIVTLDIASQKLLTGIATVTLFSGDGEPLCERLIFVQNHDQLSLHIGTDKTEYTKREKVNLALQMQHQGGSTGHFSISVINENIVSADENDEPNLLTDLLLTSDLKGFIEQPNYYFSDSGETVRNYLDALMLTQGYRRFEWKQVLHDDSMPVAYFPEKGLNIKGRITDLSDNPLKKATVTLIPSEGGPVLSQVSDDKGAFRFLNLIFMDSTRFVLSGTNAKGRNATKMTYITDNQLPAISIYQPYGTQTVSETTMSAYIENERQYHQTTVMGNSKAHLLKEVTVKSVKQDNQYRTQSLAGAGHADQVMHADEIEQIGGRLSTSLYGRLRGVGFMNGKPYLQGLSGLAGIGGGYMMVVLDGAEITIDSSSSSFDIDQIPSNQVETVEVLKYTSTSIYGMNGANGVLVITTKQGKERSKDISAVGMLPITPSGFYKARVFYSPRYDDANNLVKQPDLRSTIYWNPEIQTGKDGGTSIDYYNADGAGTYKVIIEGIDGAGNIGSQVYRYTVR